MFKQVLSAHTHRQVSIIVMRHIGLRRYFDTDDGSLPEIEVKFESAGKAAQAFEFLFSCGARDVSAYGGAKLWNIREGTESPFTGPGNVRLLHSGVVQPFHIVLGGVSLGGPTIPDLGVFVFSTEFTIDYRMGAEWGDAEIDALVLLLKELTNIGGTVSVPWWGKDGNQDFQAAVCGA